MAEAFKFIHASDLHLDQSMKGLAELPAHLKTVLANAPYESATRVFDTVISERADFVLLSGDLFDLELGGPRAAAFLLGQFERLADKEIQVFWCAGQVDQPDRWPSSVNLPDNVVTFSSTLVEDVTVRKEGEVVATIYGCGYDPKRKDASGFITPSDDGFSIALLHGEIDSAGFSAPGIRYWALGGRHKSAKLDRDNAVVAFPGTTQGRTPRESGPHGCFVCRVDANGKLRVQSVETDTVRWMPQKIAIDENIAEVDLRKLLAERALKIASEAPEQTVLVHWHIATSGDFNPALRKTDVTDRMREWLRDEFGRGEKGIWTTQVSIAPPASLPATWYEEDTILGEYLRAVGRYQSDDSLNLSLHEYMPPTVDGDALSGLGRVVQERRAEVLQQTALLGVEYLGAHKEPTEIV